MAAKLLALLIYLLVSFYGMAESSRSLKFTPEVDLFESHPRLIQRETSIGNKSYLIQPYVKQFIKLSCLSTQPIRWVLYTYDPFEESPKIEKTQRKQGNTMRFESYISWTFTFRSTNVSDASCFYERDWEKYQPDLEIFSRTFGPTVVFRKQDWVTCKGDFSSQPIVSANNSLSLPILPEPISVQCGERKLGIGSPLGRSFITLFPSFENNSWQSRIYYKTFEDAIAGNSIRVTLSKTWLHDQFHNLNFSSSHLAFAINETVEFACLAVKYLYMEGFHWKLGQTKFISADTPWQVHAIDTNHSLHVIRRNITFQGNVSGNTASSLSCLGPIWNSMNFQVSQPLNFDLHGPQAPSGSLAYSTIDDTHDEFTFIYRGWPKPTVTWFFSGNVTEAPSNQKPKDSHRHIYSITWNETRLLISQCSSYNVICHLKNFEGEVTQGVFRKKKICIIPILLTVPPAQPSSDSTGIIIGSSIGTLFIFIVSLLFAFVIWRRKYRKTPRSETMSMTENNTSEENQYFNKDFELSIKDCSIGSVPYGGLNWTSSFADSLLKGLRLTIPRFAPQNVYDKMLECWDLNSDGRPTFSEMIEFFKIFCNAEVEYTELN
ncbi:unnamed protein product [Orchesella dallaii]|uniref:Serine-threonine/tyrosine-protein kinase catalytic domain-containing protein n=1 Tax=Orchesella dallaii TaxID=48710 RepID=A0ABP1R9K6_9HEXA